MCKNKQSVFFTADNGSEPAYDEILYFGSSWDALKKMSSLQDQQRDPWHQFEGGEYLFGSDMSELGASSGIASGAVSGATSGATSAFQLTSSPLWHHVPPGHYVGPGEDGGTVPTPALSATPAAPQTAQRAQPFYQEVSRAAYSAARAVPPHPRTLVKSMSFSEGMEDSMAEHLFLPDNFAYDTVPWQFTPRSSGSDEPLQSLYEKQQEPTRSEVQTPSSVGSEPPSAEPTVQTTRTARSADDEFYDRFYNAFNNMDPEPVSSKRLSVYEQLIADKPLMDALSKKVKRGYYRCAHCPKMFSSVLDYAKHIDEFNIRREYKCPFKLCPWKILGLPRRPELRRHCAIQHKTEIPRELKLVLKLGDSDFPIMECPSPYCNKTFYRRDSYARHVSMVHEKTESRFNKRLAKVLMECPYAPRMDEHKKYVIKEMSKPKRKTK